jgi:hypothetical protein
LPDTNSKTSKKLTKGLELFALLVSLGAAYWAYTDIINGSAWGRNEIYYFADDPVSFCVVVLPKLFVATYLIYLIIKSRFYTKK